MSNQEQAIQGIDDDLPMEPVVDELADLKEKADLMGIKYHVNIGLETLRAKIKEVQDAPLPKEAPAAVVEIASVTQSSHQAAPPLAYQAKPKVLDETSIVRTKSARAHADEVTFNGVQEDETLGVARQRMKRHANELIRIRVSCQNPLKKEWEGEIFSAGNSLVGSLTKYVPFDAEDGWHVPRIIYNMIRDRQYQHFYTANVVVNGRTEKVRQGKQVKEFVIDVLEPLSVDELGELAARQAATRAID